MARALRAASALCLAIIDIDHFKAYNDTHGHLAGDAVLRDCAAAWDEALRGEDTILRFGGEEFLVVLPDCGPADATEIVERLRAATPDGPDLLGGAGGLEAGGERRRARRAGRRGAVRGEGVGAGPARQRGGVAAQASGRPLPSQQREVRPGVALTTLPGLARCRRA